MRDLALLLLVLGALGTTLRYPYVGVMVWVWISIQNPHQETFGIAHRLPLVFTIAIIATGSWLISPERKSPPKGITTGLVLALLAWTTFNSFFAVDPSFSWPYWGRAWKTMAMAIAVGTMATNKVRIHTMMWVIALSLGYYGVKGGLFTLFTGGGNHVLGPPDTMIGDNNELALALVMVLPILNYLRRHSGARAVRIGLIVSIILCVTSILGSYSRGGYIALGVVAAAFWLRGRNKLAYPIVAFLILIPLLHFMPASFYHRLDSIQNYSTDDSFQDRVASWWVSYRYAMDHFPFGAGFYGLNLQKVWDMYIPGEMHASHSIYFQTLGEQGVPALVLYMAIIAIAFLNLRAAIRDTRGKPALAWANDLGRMMQLSLLAFCVGGAGTPMNFYDVFLLWVLMSASLRELTHIRRSTALQARITGQRLLVSDPPQ